MLLYAIILLYYYFVILWINIILSVVVLKILSIK